MIEIVYTLIYILSLVFVGFSAIFRRLVDVTGFKRPTVPLILMLLSAVLFTVVIKVNTKLRIILCGCLTAILLGVMLVTKHTARIAWFKKNNWIGIVLILAVASVVLGMLMLQIRFVKLITGIALVGILLSSYWTELIDDKKGIVGISLLAGTILFEEIRRRRRGSERMQEYVVRIIPFLLAGMLALYFMPASKKPYDWAFARGIITGIENKFGVLFPSFGNSSQAGVGLGNEAGVGGNLSENKEEMLRVEFGKGMSYWSYVDGAYYEDFDGRTWSEAAENYPYWMDTIESLCVGNMLEDAEVSDYYKYGELRITYTGQNYRNLLTPAKTVAIEECTETISGAKHNLQFSKECGKETSYRTRFLLVNEHRSILPVYTALGEQITKEDWDEARKELGLSEETYSYEAFLAYREGLYDNSMSPNALKYEQLSDGVRMFLENAIGDAQTDCEKLTALEKAFNSFEYTTTPGELPAYVDTPADFLDYFLLKSKKGYCTSFATAFALLCQVEGIPVRYVQGYHVTRTNHDVTSVYNTDAHAYPEVYLKGAGWTVYEPTPGYYGKALWDIHDKMSTPTVTPTPSVKKDADEQAKEEKKLPWYVIAVPAVLCFVVLLGILFVQRSVNLRHFARLSKEEKTRTLAIRLLHMLKRQGFAIKDGETIREYADRAGTEREIALSGFATAFEKVLYAAEPPTDEEMEAFENEYREVRENLKGKNKVIYGILHFMGMN